MLSYGYTRQQPEIYRSTAIILVGESTGDPALSDVLQSSDRRELPRQLYFLRQSDVFAKKVARALSEANGEVETGWAGNAPPEADSSRLQALAEVVRQNVRIRRGDQDVPAIRIEATGSTPQKAAGLASTFARTYREHLRRESTARSRAARTFLERERSKLKKELRSLEDSIATFIRRRGQQGVVRGDSANGTADARQILADISELQSERRTIALDLELERVLLDSARSRYRRIRPQLSDRAASRTTMKLERTNQRIASLEEDLSRIRSANDAFSPRLRRQVDRRREVLDSLKRRADRLAGEYVSTSLSTDAIDPLGEQGGMERLVELKQQIGDHQVRVMRLEARQKLIDGRIENRRAALQQAPDQTLTRLERRKDMVLELYTTLSKSLQKTRVAERSEPNRGQIIRHASAPSVPVAPDLWHNVVMALLLGGVSASGVVLAYDAFDDTVERPEDLEGGEERLFGTVPSWDQMTLSGAGEGVDSSADEGATGEGIVSPLSPAAEAYRHIATNIRSGLPRPASVILVTSPNEQEGKTSVTANLSVMFCEAGFDTLMVDGDLRGPDLHRLFGLARASGLTEALAHDTEPDATLLSADDPAVAVVDSEAVSSNGSQASSDDRPPSSGRLGLVTAGAPVPQPSLLLQEARVRSVFGHVRGRWDIILIDTPPAMLFDDARRLLPVCDIALLVGCAGRTKLTAYREVKSRLGAVHDSEVVGVLNRCDVHAGGYGSDYARRYGAYHDEAVSPSGGSPSRRAAEAVRRGVRTLIRGG